MQCNIYDEINQYEKYNIYDVINQHTWWNIYDVPIINDFNMSVHVIHCILDYITISDLSRAPLILHNPTVNDIYRLISPQKVIWTS